MEPLQSLAVALGLSALSGVRLYLTVFLTSLSINQGWLKLSATHASMDVLGSDAVMIVSGILLLMEFLADKVPGFDSAWDSVHSLIRPVGATLVALQVLGEWDPSMKVVAALCMGGVAAVTHVTKASTRLLVNSSPEPFSNIALSTAEDVMTAGLFALLIKYPLMTGTLIGVAVLVCLWALPKCFRMIKATFWLIGQRLFRATNRTDALPKHLDAAQAQLAAKAFGAGRSVAWAMEGLTGKITRVPGLRRNHFGTLAASGEDANAVVFLARKLFRTAPVTISLTGCAIEVQRTFLSENLVISGGPEGRRVVLRFPRAEAQIVSRIAESLRQRTGQAGQVLEATTSAGAASELEYH